MMTQLTRPQRHRMLSCGRPGGHLLLLYDPCRRRKDWIPVNIAPVSRETTFDVRLVVLTHI
jgi:hypothetical protein